jgi:hypothetical protein
LYIEPAFSRRWLAVLLACVLAAGLAVQIIGSALYWGHWLRIASAASDQWLGRPRCTPTSPPAEPCYPDDNALYFSHWLPSLQPIAGHFWLLRHAPFGDSFETAEADAPWQVNGKIHIPAAADWYRGTVVDWWALGWKDYPVAAVTLGSLMTLALVGGGVLWWRRARAGVSTSL